MTIEGGQKKMSPLKGQHKKLLREKNYQWSNLRRLGVPNQIDGINSITIILNNSILTTKLVKIS